MQAMPNLTSSLTCVNGNCSELAPHLHTLCSMTRIAKRRCATQACDSQASPSSGEMCECTRCNSNSKHSAASPRQPSGKRRPANGPLAKARRNGSGHRAGSELVCSCWKSSCGISKKKRYKSINWKHCKLAAYNIGLGG